MIDTHGHLNLDPLFAEWQGFLNEAIKDSVNHIIIPGTDLDSSRKAIDIANTSENCSAMVGLHPHLAADIHRGNTSLKDSIEQLTSLANDNRLVAIGEIGLDYFHLDKDIDQIKSIQHDLFSAQLKLADQLNLPVSIHVREAQDDALEIIKAHRSRGILHCFSGDENYLTQALDLGLYISFAGNLTFNNAIELQQLIKLVPSDRLLLETDAPYLNPNRGEFPNTPANVVQIYQFASELLNISPNQLADQINQNAAKLFQIKL